MIFGDKKAFNRQDKQKLFVRVPKIIRNMSTTTDEQVKACTPEGWQGFKPGVWQSEINVRDFIQQNYTPYTGGDDFLAGPTTRTEKLWDTVKDLLKKEIEAGGVLDADTEVVSSIIS